MNRKDFENWRGKDPIESMIDLVSKCMPDNHCLMENPDRFPAIKKAVLKIANLIKEQDPYAEVAVGVDQLLGTAFNLKIKTSIIKISSVKEFCDSLALADTVEISTCEDGQISLSVTFYKAWIPSGNSDNFTG
ncbi:MAG: hypothetical protein LUE27_02200 [Clostridia bacterium]|nr:hypothetical protein [Clostridia bacterium]